MIDGVSVKDYNLSYITQVGYVPDEPVIFSNTISYNIAYGVEASDDAIIQAAKFADAHRFICLLEDGYDTVISDDTSHGSLTLSKGQAQRISIARLFARNPAVAILDDPCGDFDYFESRTIRTAVRRMLRYPVRRTGLLIAHEVEDMEFADNIAVLENGRIVEYGKREDLANQPGSAFRLLLEEEGQEAMAMAGAKPSTAAGRRKGQAGARTGAASPAPPRGKVAPS